MSWHPHRRLLTVTEAAASVERPTGTIYRWVSEGRLVAHATRGKRYLYLESDVLRVDAETRARARLLSLDKDAKI